MVEFSRLITTKAGQELNAKMIAGEDTVKFTKVCISEKEYELNDLENLTAFENIVQERPVLKISRTNKTGVKIETVFSNYDLEKGYYMRTLGLYASDPDETEILYAVAISVTGQCYMPPNNGITSSSAYISLVYSVGNADNVSLDVDPGCFATIGDLREIEKLLAGLQDRIEANELTNRETDGRVELHEIDIEDLRRRLTLLELMYATDISKNPFTVTFADLDGIVAEGVWNEPQKRLEF